MKEILAKLARLVRWFRFHVLCLFKLELWLRDKDQDENSNKGGFSND